MGNRVRLLLPCLVALGLSAVGPPELRARERRIVLHAEDLRLEAVAGPRVTRRVCKKVLTECRKAYAKIATRFALNSSRIFFTGERLPLWMDDAIRKDPCFCVIVEEGLRITEMGADAYLKRMKSGRHVIYLPAPVDELSPDDVHRIWREIAHAILAHTSWRACPLWLREGIAEHMAAEATEGEHSLQKTLEEELRESVENLQVEGILATTDRGAWGRCGGRAVSWALVHLLDATNVKLIPSLFNQSRLLLNHLVLCPSNAKVLEEYTQIVHAQLTASGMTPQKLQAALVTWIRSEFPEGSAFRRTDAYKSLKRMKLPVHYGLGISGNIGHRYHYTDEFDRVITYQPFGGGKVVWNLPWRSSFEAWWGVRGKPGVNYTLRPSKARDGYYLKFPGWSAKPRGSARLQPMLMELPRQLCKYGFIWVGVLSPRGLGYMFQKQYKLK